jgi:ferric-dicitrate binding protein FerR (iron transport regulator)
MAMQHENEEYIWGLIARVLSGEATDDEEQFLMGWRQQSPANEQVFRSCERIWMAADKRMGGFDADKAWQQTSRRLHLPDKDLQSGRLRKIVYAVAAGVLVVLATTFFVQTFFNSTTTVIAMETSKQVVLPDGTSVEVNRHSQIEYPRRFSGKIREVKLLRGEAFFNVTHNVSRPFVVTTPVARVRVLGTRFNVCVRTDGDVQVMVESGKVSFQSINSTHEILLVRNESAIFSSRRNQMIKSDMVDWNLLAWKTHRLVFRDAELAYVYDILSRTYGKNIKSDNAVLGYRLTATFDNLSLEDVLKIIDKTFMLQTQSRNDTFVVKRYSAE